MSLLSLRDRLTTDVSEYIANRESAESKVLVVGEKPILDNAGFTLDLHVGSAWFDCYRQTYYELPSKGLKIKAGQATVIEVAEEIGVPHNAFGIVTGKGRLIYQGAFVSSGKIDPGFRDRLLIGIFNGSREVLNLKRGDSLCGCAFVLTETHPTNLAEHRTVAPRRREKRKALGERFYDWWRSEWKVVVAWTIALISATGSLGKFLLDLLKNHSAN